MGNENPFEYLKARIEQQRNDAIELSDALIDQFDAGVTDILMKLKDSLFPYASVDRPLSGTKDLRWKLVSSSSPAKAGGWIHRDIVVVELETDPDDSPVAFACSYLPDGPYRTGARTGTSMNQLTAGLIKMIENSHRERA